MQRPVPFILSYLMFIWKKRTIKELSSVIKRYAKQYPSDYKTQEAMIAPLMEVSRKKKDYKSY
jgi:hypothetical protein